MRSMRQRYKVWAAGRLREERGASILEFIFSTIIVLVVFLIFLQLAFWVSTWQMANYAAFMSARTMVTNSTLWPVDWGGNHARTAKNIMASSYKGSNYEAKAIYFTIPFVVGGVLVYWELDLILPPPLNRPLDLTDPDDLIPWAICSILPDWICSGSDIKGDNRAMVLGYAPMPFWGFFALPGTGQLSGGIPRECEMWNSCALMDLTDNY